MELGMSGQARSQASRAVRLIVFLAVLLSLLAPVATSAAQVPEASPVIEPTATPSPEPTVEPTATSEPTITPTATTEPTATSASTPTAESDFSAAAIGSVVFDETSYNVGSSSSTLVTITVFTIGETNLLFSLAASGTFTFGPMTANNHGVQCFSPQSGSVLEGTIRSGPGNNSCEILVLIYSGSSNPPGTEGSMTFSTGPIGGPYTEDASANVRVVATPVIALSLSDETPGNDDIVTVTAVMTIDTTTNETIEALLLVSIPNGVTLNSDSSSATCTPACAGPPLIDENPPTVRAIVNIPPSASAPLTVLLQFDVRINTETPPGSILTFESVGSAQGANATPTYAPLTVTLAPTLVLNLGVATAIPGEIVDVFAMLRNPASPNTISREEISVALPDGLTYYAGSGEMECSPAVCSDLADPTGTDPIVGFGDYPAGTTGPLSTFLYFYVTVDPNAAIGTTMTLSGSGSSAGVASNTSEVTLEIVPPPDAPELEVALSDDTPNPGDTIIVTVTLTSSTDISGISREQFDATLPPGTQLVPASETYTCNPNECIDESLYSGLQSVGGYVHYPETTTAPFTTTFTYRLGILNTVALGVPLTIETTASSQTIPADPVSSSFTVPPDTDVVATDGVLEVPFGAGRNSQLAATGGTGNYQFTLDTQATKGIASVNEDGAFSYIAFIGQTGSDQFTFNVTDGNSTDTGTVTITILDPRPVVGVDQTLDVAFEGDASGTLTASGGEDLLVFAIDSQATKGIATINANGSFTYAATDGQSGADQFTFSVTDGYTTDTGTVSVTIAAPVPVVAQDQTLDVAFEGDGSGTLTATGGEDLIVFALDSQAGKGTATIDPDGSFTYTANDGQTGPDQFTFTATDTHTTDTGTVSVTIGAPDALVAESLTVTIDSSGVTHGNLADQVSGGIPPYTFEVDSPPTKGQITISPEGLFTYTATEGASGPDSFTYTVTDSQTAPTAAAVVTGTVNLILPAAPTPTPTQPVLTPIPTDEVTPTPTSTLEPGITPTATSDDSNPGPGDPGDPGDEDPTATSTPGDDPGDVNDDGQTDGDDPITDLPSTGTGQSTTSSILLLTLISALALLATAAALTRRRRSR
jgi:VCBS repeat-containing protein